jgi:hypothetical protein
VCVLLPGMFNILSKGLRKKGQGGTSRYLGDLEHTMRAAGSNLLFAVVTEVSDSVLKGAETSGFDGLVSLLCFFAVLENQNAASTSF